jgi:hypothetical protein
VQVVVQVVVAVPGLEEAMPVLEEFLQKHPQEDDHRQIEEDRGRRNPLP